MKKVLFIDRDGTIIAEPPTDFQVDSLEKLAFLPHAITALHQIATQLDYELVMVTNQDGLGTNSFPEETFWPAHNAMLQTLAGEDVTFAHMHIDPSFEHENSPNRKPRTGMLGQYFSADYDLANSFVIGDRLTDAQLAYNLGAKAILLGQGFHLFDKHEESGAQVLEKEGNVANFDKKTVSLVASDWNEILNFLRMPPRMADVIRDTHETKIHVKLNLDGTGKTDIKTGLGFFDHMLEQLGKHSGADLWVRVQGDLHVDEHHTIEDAALALGMAYKQALGEKKGINRYGFLLPMDDVLVQAAIDFSGRNWLVWEADFRREKVGDMPTEMFYHFFKSFSDAAACNLNIKAEGQNEHHKIEAIFKAVAKAIRMAAQRNADQINELPTTKGML
ncbi:imidazoleglycerol-phosphate dehydratase / histidinol-phosphatase [Flexibacter flexilis DSM 6793]|uniref:Histidine biosynthesis bifunctional protein HisB n=1 Tax=Flexibacter flexilis DSM 6793 TaxID=927664 RepID=A0A1I1N3I6_9BACT|nr:bifunctional histidinol-phosphatase/imidazoleglycerol-phosphate dehydratase HisB [Flexibacter flexilis]SFC91995.1 imidazoleglycerol-phosphate dehydratase / histidinol-phosphatase [Flexibacter flexilis DSM 6793]